MSRRAGVLGHPIGHSLSPTLHRAAYRALDLDWEYEAYDVDSGALGAFLDGVDRDWVGLSLTMPLKVEAIPLMDFVEPFAKLLGVVNTVLVGGRDATRQLVGANTDVYGIVTALGEAGLAEAADEPRARRAVVLGGGATAISAVAALGQCGCLAPTVVVRSRGRAGALLRAATAMGLSPRFVDLGETDAVRYALESADAVVSTVPADAGAELAARGTAGVRGVLLDAVYDPIVTPLGAAWEEWGGTRVGGERMLLHQAAEQVRLMTGRVAPVEDMERALRAVLPAS